MLHSEVLLEQYVIIAATLCSDDQLTIFFSFHWTTNSISVIGHVSSNS